MKPQTIRSFQDIQKLKQALNAQRAQQAVRARAERAQQERQQQQHHLFALAVGKVRPLPTQHQRVPLSASAPPPVAVQRQRDEQAVLQEALSDDFDFSTLLETDESLSYRQPGVGADVVRKLRRGDWSIQRQLDLHGLRRDAARAQLAAFIRDCCRQGVRCVRVITGKGLGSPGKTPVLKNKVYGWLIQKQEVLAFVQARPAEGGAGALVVLLR